VPRFGEVVRFADIVFLELEDVELAHARALAEHGGAAGLRDRNQLASAIMAPRATWEGTPLYATLAEMAAAYALGIALNHAFVDGNKRTAFIAMVAFLEVNGVTLTLGDRWIAVFEALAAGTLTRDALVESLVAELPGTDPIAIEP
jgi:death on curing protein